MNINRINEICEMAADKTNETVKTVMFLSQAVTDILTREFGFRKFTKMTADADGNPEVVKPFDLDWLNRVWERQVVNYECFQALTAHSANQYGDAQQFTPLIAPFHVDANGEPLTQIRIYSYTPKAEPGKGQARGTIHARIEPFGFQTTFDVNSRYAAINASAKATESEDATAQPALMVA